MLTMAEKKGTHVDDTITYPIDDEKLSKKFKKNLKEQEACAAAYMEPLKTYKDLR